ncbi:MAG: response regulator transcription factor [Candidatus Melainabacteria bacterium]|mgnify:CR=1 FL=1|nr:response regulator transcription factor [Candidatus Melainabacteria bacterium]
MEVYALPWSEGKDLRLLLMAKILVVEDEQDLLNILKASLEAQGHKVDVSSDGADAIEKLGHFKFDLVILDWHLPNKSGIEVLSHHRNSGGQTPVLMLTGRNQAMDKAAGLDTGADDYLTKPFDEREFDARVRALLRRPHTFTGTVLALGDITIEQDTRRVFKSGKEIVLLPLEYNLLEFLIRHRGQSFSAEALLDRVWKTGTEVSEDAVRTVVKTLRRKIANPDGSSVIQTVYGVGYRASESTEK